MKDGEQDFAVISYNDEKDYLELSIHHSSLLQQFIVYLENITERELARKELEFFAYHDPLTGLPNLKRLEMDLTELIEKGSEYPFYLFSIGVKRLQLITTAHGHSVSDALIRSIVIRIQNIFFPAVLNYKLCRIYRFTGAKFEVLVEGQKMEKGFLQLVDELDINIKRSSKNPIKTNFGEFFVDIQFGCVSYPEHGYSANMLLKNSTAALNDAQKNNSIGVNLFNHEIAFREQKWLQLETDLRQANYDEELFLCFQPKVNITSKALEGVEALVRWNHPEKGLISPVDFIPVAEESGLLISMGDWIMDSAIRQIKQWQETYHIELQVAVNVSPNQLLSNGYFEKIKKLCDKYQLAPGCLEVEITEEVMVEDIDLCIEVLEELRGLGVSIAIDDFGTGYSSLSYLRKLPLSKLKIDRAFITNIHCTESQLAIVKTIIALAREMKLKTIAEGIESQDELFELERLGCEQGQGYLFSKPLTADEFERLYLERGAGLKKING
nr:bifunctional diguanylate cyclase/phosphodiesterase [Aliikangiella sp. G2MR2-5]